jgi:amino acid adenylation domain-containing protein
MTTEKLLEELGARNIKLRRNCDELILIGNQETLEPSLVSQVRAHKASLLELIGKMSSGTLAPGTRITPEMVTLVELTQQEIDEVVQQVPGGAANIQDIYPLAPLQEGILFHHLMEGKGDPYLLGVMMRFASRERMDQYIEAVQWVIDRHDILRTGILWEGLREPVQVVWRKAQLTVEEVELGADGDTAEKLYERFCPRRVRINVRRAPLLRAIVVQDKKDGSWLMMRLVHHLIGDHYSMDLMQEEVEAYLMGRQGELPRPAPFREQLAQARLGVTREEHERFFREMLGDVKEPTAPFGLMEVMGDGTGVAEATLKLEPGINAMIRERARKLKVSAAILFHLAWACVVARTSGREEAIFGTVLLGQLRRGASDERAMGVFINTLPVRIAVGTDSVEVAVRKTQKVLAELAGHEHASLVLAQRCSGVVSPQPLFTSLLNYRHIRVSGARTENARAWEGIKQLRGEERSNYPVALSVNDLGESSSLTALTDASLDPMRLCKFMCQAIESIVEALETTQARMVCTIDVLPLAERKQILYEWNDTATEYPADKCIHEIFEEQVRKTPAATAVVYEGTSLSYGELNRQANKLAHHLRELGVRPDMRVAIYAERSLELIVGLLGILKAGGAYVPLDPAYPVERLSYMLEDAAPSFLLTQSDLTGRLGVLKNDVTVIDLVADTDLWQKQPSEDMKVCSLGLSSAHLAYVIYTSGSTGKPKGAMLPHSGLCNLVVAQGEAFGISGESRILQFASFGFDASVFEIVMALCHGGSLHFARAGEVLAGEMLENAIAEHGITHATLPPAVLSGMPEEMRLESATTLIVAGDVLGEGLVRRWSVGRKLINAYGPTEVTIWASQYECCGEEGGPPPIGRPIGNTRIYILDEQMEPAPVGVTGEMYIGGAGLGRGYLRRAELTAERFVPDPYTYIEDEHKDKHKKQGGARMYRTGDLGRWRADGAIEFLGRNDYQVKVRGFRIELGEIEAQLMEHTAVREAVVIAWEAGGGNKRLVAYYTSRENKRSREGEEAIRVDELRTHLVARLPEYMVPAAYVRMEKMPLTSSGKVDRQALPKPDENSYAVQEYEAPQGLVEVILARIWSDLLGVERVGRKDDFFELGGHSLLALQVIARVQRELGRETALKDLFTYPRLEAFASILELPSHQSAERALPIREAGTEPPVFFTHSADDQTGYAWSITPHIDDDIPVYELPAQQQDAGSRLRTIEGQAQRMVKMMRAVRPSGPYRIVGYCFGSFLAYEIARQLVGADEEVFLALFDFRLISGLTDRLPLVVPSNVNQDLKIKFLTAVRDYVIAAKMPESAQKEAAELRQSSKGMEELFYLSKDKGWLPPPWVNLTPARMQRLLVHLVDMERSPYLFSRLPIDVHMFVARDAEGAADLPADFAALVPRAQLRCFPIPGDHDTMVQNPNTKDLGRSLSRVLKEATATARSKASASVTAALVCLWPPQLSGTEKGIPLFCVPGTPAPSNCFVDLASSFGERQPVYGFQSRGFNEGDVPHTSIEAEARFYLKGLEAVCASGPVHLLGHARGGQVAFEMALLLQSAGRDVLSLTLLDAPPPDKNSRDVHESTPTQVVGSLLKFIEKSVGRAVITLAELERQSAAMQRKILLELLAESGVLPAGAANGDLYRVLQSMGAALRTGYVSHRSFSGTLHLIEAAESAGAENQDDPRARSGWERWASSVVLHRSPRSSIAMLRPPHVKYLAEILEKEIKRSTGDVLFQSAAST